MIKERMILPAFPLIASFRGRMSKIEVRKQIKHLTLYKFLLSLIHIIYGFLPCSGYADHKPKTSNNSPIYIVYHVGILNNWQEIMEEQLEALTSSGLLEASAQLIVCFVGDDTPIIYSLLENTPYTNKIQIVHASEDLSVCEFPSIALVKEIAEHHGDAKILYFHSKGVMHFNKPTEGPIRDWRLYMEYFLIHHWKTCIETLNNYDICGVNWGRGHPWLRRGFPHFSGNFWWACADYIKTLPELPKPYLFENRLDCEWFIGKNSSQNRVKTFHQSRENHHINLYPRDKYAYD